MSRTQTPDTKKKISNNSIEASTETTGTTAATTEY
jgi:hypothetical protein